jgi:hypothetical protein
MMPSTIIPMINLFRFPLNPNSPISRLLIKGHLLFSVGGITNLTTKVKFYSDKAGGLRFEGFIAIITHGVKIGTICLTNFPTCFRTMFMSLLKSLNAFHIYIIAQFPIYENPELLKDNP